MQKDYQEKWKKKDPGKSRISKTYGYRNEKGKLLFETIRFEPKGFSQRRPDYKGDYIWNLKDTRRILYRLRELIKGEDPVFILEGEKDVDNLREWKLTATCNPMGAGKWKIQERKYNPFLKGRDVIIIPDNDLLNIQRDLIIEKHLIGEKHLIQVAISLQNTAKNIKILRLPGASDFSDWKEKDKNNTEEKLLILASEAVDWKETKEETIKNVKELEGEIRKKKKEASLVIASGAKEKPSKRIFITGKQLIEEEIKELPAPVKKGLFVPERYTILAASDGEGKTLFCTQLTLSAITGTTFLNFFPIPKPVRVLYFCGENSRGDIKAKIGFQKIEIEKILGRDITKELDRNFILVEPININFWLNPKDKTEINGWLEEIKPKIIIFDPLADFISSERSLSDDTLARGTVKTLTGLAQKYKCFPIITTHLKKEAINQQTGRSIVTPENVWNFVHGTKFWLNSAAAQVIMIKANLQKYPKAKKLVFKFKTITEVEPLLIMRNENLFYQELSSDKMSLASLTAEDVKIVLERRCKGQQVESILIDTVRKDFGCGVTMAKDLINTAIKTNLIYKDKKDNLIKITSVVENKLFDK